MTTSGTVRKMTDKQRGDLVATMAGAIPSDLSFDEAQAIIGAKGPFVAAIREVFAKRRHIQVNSVPAADEWFDLAVNNDSDPMEVVTSAGYYNAASWEYLGPKFNGTKTYRAKLVRLGYVHNLAEAREKADEMGYRLVEGQAREAFKIKVSWSVVKNPVVFGGSEWQHPNGDATVACLLSNLEDGWNSGFRWSISNDFGGNYRWLVVGK